MELWFVQVMPFWDLKYCAEHENRDRCCSCQRVEVRTIPSHRSCVQVV
jgi:hypothetical protein